MLGGDGSIVAEYCSGGRCSISLAARRLGCSNGHLSQCVNGVVPAVKGTRFVQKVTKAKNEALTAGVAGAAAGMCTYHS